MNYQVSPSYQVYVNYINDINTPTFISERPLNWLNVTLLSGKRFLDTDVTALQPEVLSDHDLRIKVSTLQKLTREHPLYTCVFPSRTIESEYPEPQTLFSLDKYGNPIPRDSKVTYIRKIKSRIIFDYKILIPQNSSSSFPSCELNVEAVIALVDHFQGKDLEDMRTGLGLSLHVGNQPLLDWLSVKIPAQRLEEWLDQVVDHVLAVSEAIQQFPSPWRDMT